MLLNWVDKDEQIKRCAPSTSAFSGIVQIKMKPNDFDAKFNWIMRIEVVNFKVSKMLQVPVKSS